MHSSSYAAKVKYFMLVSNPELTFYISLQLLVIGNHLMLCHLSLNDLRQILLNCLMYV
jgi:hypothetical protein